MTIKKISSLFIILVLLLTNFYSVSFAEPFYFHPKLIDEIKNNIKTEKTIGEQIKYLDSVSYRLSLIENKEKGLIIRDVKALKKDIIKSNIREYTINKYLTGSKNMIIKKYKPYYLGLKNNDIKADIHINYITNLEKNFGEELELNENGSTYKAYIYILNSYKNKNAQNLLTTQGELNSLDEFAISNEFRLNNDYYKKRFDKLLSLEKFNPLSKNDFNKIFAKIQTENISPESDYIKGFKYWYASNKDILTKNTITLKSNLYHTKQEFSLSCEANSIKDVLNYYNLKNGKNLVNENEILSIINTNTGELLKDSSGSLYWADPHKEFVGNYTGKQSINPENFTGYGVYATPIINSTKNIFATHGLNIKKSFFNEKEIINSIVSDNPVMFWYLSEVKIGKINGYQTKPISWKTNEGKIVKGYIGEHTGVIIGFDISNEGKIEKLYFYEGKNTTIQVVDYNFAKQTASFFNEMIVINKSNSSSSRLVFNN